MVNEELRGFSFSDSYISSQVISGIHQKEVLPDSSGAGQIKHGF